MDQDEREAATLARSAEILSRAPSEAEIAEHEERARQNLIAAIMARPSPSGVVPGNPCSTPRDDAASKTDASKSETSIGRASVVSDENADPALRLKAAVSLDRIVAREAENRRREAFSLFPQRPAEADL